MWYNSLAKNFAKKIWRVFFEKQNQNGGCFVNGRFAKTVSHPPVNKNMFGGLFNAKRFYHSFGTTQRFLGS